MILYQLLLILYCNSQTFNEQVRCIDYNTNHYVVGTLAKELILLDNSQTIIKTLSSLPQDPKSCVLLYDMQLVIGGGSSGDLYKWNITSNQLTIISTIHTSRVNTLIRLPSQPIVFSGSFDNTIQKINVISMTSLGSFLEHTSVVSAIILKDTKGISVGNDKIIRIWDINSLIELDTIQTSHTGLINGVIESQNVIATGSIDRSIIFWDMNSHEVLQQIQNAHSSDINCMTSITNNVFASGSNDNTIKLWNISLRQIIRTINDHTGAVTALARIQNSETFLAGDANYKVIPETINNCSSNQFFLNSCTACSNKCSTCFESDSNCLTCSMNRITPPTCNCDINYYELNGNCQACLHKCNGCTSDTLCIECKGDRVGTDCLCPDKTYDDNTSLNCVPCVSHCISCDQSGCKECESGRLTPNCFCSDGQYDLNGVCTTCLFKCAKCTAGDSCSECKGDRAGTDCLCQEGYFDDGISINCQKCIDNCLVCDNKLICQTCKTNYATEYCKCPSDYYVNDSLACIKCNDGCATCNSNTSCLTCVDSKAQPPSCNCLDGYYKNESTGVCTTCLFKCAKCTAGDSCSECKGDRAGTDCLCQEGYFDDGISINCQKCIDNCLVCDNKLICQTCKTNYATEYCKCPSDYYVNDSLACIKCNNGCATCDSNTGCLTCNFYIEKNLNEKYIIEKKQIDRQIRYHDQCNNASLPDCACQKGFFKLGDSCSACIAYCEQCISISECQVCTSPRIIPTCKCPQNYYENSSHICVRCDHKCAECNELGCLTCLGDRINTPNCNCPQSKYDDHVSIQCQNCIPNCLECDNDCTKCTENRSLPTCTCIKGYLELNQVCEACVTKCATCSEKLNNCLTCYDPTLSAPNCFYCPQQTYYYNESCLPCFSNCKSCVNSTSCEQCLDNRILPECNCPSGYYELSNQCIQCPQQCTKCDATKCYECIESIRYGFSCACPIGYYDSGICQKCAENCKQCTSLTNCQWCDGIRIGPQCECPEGYYEDSNECKKCDDKCLSCFNQYSCQTCLDQLKSPPQCICKEHQSYVNEVCLDCPQYCDACTSPLELNSCTKCIGIRLLPSCICPSNYYSLDNGDCQSCELFGQYCNKCSSFSCQECALQLRQLPNCNCPQGYFESSKYCLLCNPVCLTCNHPLNCTQCKQNDSIPPTCTCSVGSYETQLGCQDCISHCLLCSNGFECQQCEINRIGTLKCQCIDGYYENQDKDCLKCPFNCLTCNINGCSKCKGNRITDQCICNQGYYDDGKSENCQSCISNCIQCSNADSCLQCIDGYELIKNSLCFIKQNQQVFEYNWILMMILMLLALFYGFLYMAKRKKSLFQYQPNNPSMFLSSSSKIHASEKIEEQTKCETTKQITKSIEANQQKQKQQEQNKMELNKGENDHLSKILQRKELNQKAKENFNLSINIKMKPNNIRLPPIQKKINQKAKSNFIFKIEQPKPKLYHKTETINIDELNQELDAESVSIESVDRQNERMNDLKEIEKKQQINQIQLSCRMRIKEIFLQHLFIQVLLKPQLEKNILSHFSYNLTLCMLNGIVTFIPIHIILQVLICVVCMAIYRKYILKNIIELIIRYIISGSISVYFIFGRPMPNYYQIFCYSLLIDWCFVQLFIK